MPRRTYVLRGIFYGRIAALNRYVTASQWALNTVHKYLPHGGCNSREYRRLCMDYLERMNLQLFAGDDDDDDYDLDEFDLDLGDDDDDDDDDNFGFDSNTGMVAKDRVSKLVQKRLAKEKAKFESELAAKSQTYDQFKKLYGVSPEEAITFGMQQIGQQQAPQQAAQQEQLDPYTAKLIEIDNWRKEEDSRRQREREALEFVREFPGLADKDIPAEVLARRARGGLTLAEAYKAYMYESNAKNAAQSASQAAARNINARKAMRAEGADYTGSNKATAEMLDPEERKMAADFGMTPKELIAYRRKAEKYRDKL
jgi:hypothetical protein